MIASTCVLRGYSAKPLLLLLLLLKDEEKEEEEGERSHRKHATPHAPAHSASKGSESNRSL